MQGLRLEKGALVTGFGDTMYYRFAIPLRKWIPSLSFMMVMSRLDRLCLILVDRGST
jgi:hypothetical protein